MKTYALLALGLVLPGVAWSMGEDDPVLFMGMLEKLELRAADGPDPRAWEGYAWLGKDLDKLWFKTEGERTAGEFEEAEIQLLYSRAVAPFWDVQAGWRRDFYPKPGRDWLAVGLQGLAPYYFETDAALFVGESGRTAARLMAEYELMFTQRWALSPELELNVYGKSDPELGIGSGLSDASLGLRLRYEIRREFAPYVGLHWTRMFGGTAEHAREEGEDVQSLQWVVGVRAWF